MSEQMDEEIGRLLREDAPAERDALFRIGVLERREQRRYESRQRLLIISAVAAALLFAAVLTVSRNLPREGLLPAGIAAVFGAAVLVAGAISIRGIRQALRWIRGS